MKFKAGKYYIGDLCYCLPDKEYDKWVCEEDQDDMPDTVMFESTAYGDGTYYDQLGNQYYVDAGIIGICPVELIKSDFEEDKGIMTLGNGYNIVEFKEDFTVDMGNGYFEFGHISIDTNEDDEIEPEIGDDY